MDQKDTAEIYIRQCSALIVRSFNCFGFILVHGVKKSSNFIIWHVAVWFSEHRLLKRLSFFLVYSCLLCHRRWPQVHASISGLPILFHWSTSQLLCQYYTIWMTLVLQYSLESGGLIPSVPVFFLKITLVIQSLLCFHTNRKTLCSSSVKNAIGNFIDCLGWYRHFDNIDSSNLVASLAFSMYSIMSSANSWQFYFFSNFDLFYFSSLIAMAKTSKTIK